MKFSVWLLLTCFFVSGVSPIFGKGLIDLVALKKQEEERRKKITKSKQSVTDANVNLIGSGGKSYGFVQMESEEPPEEGIASEAAPDNESQADETKQPDFWKKQQVALESRIMQLKENIASEQLQLNKLWSDFYLKNIASEQNAIKAQISQLTNQIEQNKLFLSEAETQLAVLFEKARKAGIPPGWLR
jgi:hypothetical protein